jgi:hypothetical protein
MNHCFSPYLFNTVERFMTNEKPGNKAGSFIGRG